jgi:DNA-binding CsgD family transcriptional regulator
MRKRDEAASGAATLSDRVVAMALPSTSPPQMVAVSGDPGSGRTTLLREVVARLHRDVVWVDCSVFAHRTPWRSMHEAVSSTSPQIFPSEMAAELATRLAAPAHPDEIGALIWSVIGAGVPVMGDQVVVLDDFDLLDPASRGVAGHLLRRVAQFGGVPVVVSVASGGEPVGGHVATVDIEPSTSDEVRTLVEDLIEAPVPYRVADALRSGTGGNLLAVVEAVGRLTPEQLEGRDLLPHPLPLGNAAAQRLLGGHREWIPGRHELMAALAVDPYVTVDQARRLAGSTSVVDEAMVAGAVEQTALGIRAGRPTEALASWALAPGVVRRRVHGILADGPDAWCAPLHRLIAGVGSSPEQAFAAAVECHRLGPPGHVALALDAVGWSLPSSGLPVAQLLMADGYLTSVRRIVDAPTPREPPLRFVLDGLRSRLAVISGHLRDPLVEPPRSPAVGSDPEQWVRTVLGTVRSLIHREDFGAARRLLDGAAAGLAAAPPVSRALARFVRAELGYQQREEWSLTELTRAAEDWLSSQQGDEDPISVSIMVFYLLAVGNPALAGAILNHTEPAAADGSLVRVAHLVGRVQTEVVWGRYVAADHLIDSLDREMPYSEAGAHTIGPVINVAAARGADAVRDRIEWRFDHPDLGGQPPHARSEVAAANGLRYLVEGSYGQALALLDQALRSRSALFTGATAVMASLLETSRALGASAAQNRNLRSSLGGWWPDRFGERYAGLEARCDALCADDEDLDGRFQMALDRSSVDFPVDVARTHLAYGRCLLQAGRPRDGDQQLERAAAVFTNEGLHGWVAHVQRLRSSPSPPVVEAGLTPTERDIVALVLQRHTNAEIARQLFMSKRTVELHLTRVFRKVGVSRKSELIELDTVRELVGPPAAR